ncbi:hypothetical protein ACFV2N_26675 [Streptomyces sp. NPDC059680]|uniref:dCTP deaminase domain-containing protein n=1 Tax=Streptomyces sp. NPDC059680 TaxID=3346904 RepID=UPI0036B9A6A9
MCATKKKVHLPKDLGEPASLLTDRQIRDAVRRGYLFREGYADYCVRYSSYELRASSHAEKLGYAEGGRTFHQRIEVNDDAIAIDPGESVRLYCLEQVNVPHNVYGRVTVLGQLFSAGLAGGNTYLDPGFRGELYVTLANISAVSLRLPVGSPVARLEFEKLGEDVQEPHSGSEHVRAIELTYSTKHEDLPEDIQDVDFGSALAELQEIDPSQRFDRRILLAGQCLGIAWRHMLDAEKDIKDLRNDLVFHRAALYFLFALLVGVAWVALSVTPTGRATLHALAQVPPLAKFIIPISISTILLAVQKEVRRVVREMIVAVAEKWREVK